MQISKRILITILATIVGVLVGCSSNGVNNSVPSPAPSATIELKSRELHVFNWSNYIGSKTISDFEQRFGVKVVYDNYSSNDELYAKLKAGATGYDVIVPSDYMVETMVKEGMLQPLDRGQLPNLRNISDKFLHLPFDPDNAYSVPYFWGSTGIGVNTSKVAEEPAGWGMLFDAKYKKKMSVLDDSRYSIGMALKSLGYSANSTSPEEIKLAKDRLIQQKPLVRAYSSDTYIDLLTSGDVWISYGFSGDVYQAKKQNPAIRYYVPREGTILGIDNLCIPKGAPNPQLALIFINYILDAQVASQIANEIRYPTPNRVALDLIDPDLRSDPSVYPPDEVMQKSEFLRNVGDAVKLYDTAWTEIKAR